jgi:hypothetical protein
MFPSTFCLHAGLLEVNLFLRGKQTILHNEIKVTDEIVLYPNV